MDISDEQIRALAESYSADELRGFLRAALEEQATGSVITSAATGAGTSYSRTITASPEERVRLLQLAIEYKEERVVCGVIVERFVCGRPVC